MTNDEGSLNDEASSPKAAWAGGAIIPTPRTLLLRPPRSAFGIRHSFVIGHLAFSCFCSRRAAKAARAASLSAAFLLLPLPRASSTPLWWTVHSKSRSWSGPEEETTEYWGADKESDWSNSCNSPLGFSRMGD